MTAANGTINATAYSGDGSALTGVSSIPSGSTALFFQGSAPSGWTQNTSATINTTTLQVVTGSGGGLAGSDAFATVFTGTKSTASGPITFDDASSAGASTGTLAVGDTTLSTPTIPSHSHPNNMSGRSGQPGGDPPRPSGGGGSTGSTGGGGTHSHPISGSVSLSGSVSATTDLTVPDMDIKFANVIACSKD